MRCLTDREAFILRESCGSVWSDENWPAFDTIAIARLRREGRVELADPLGDGREYVTTTPLGKKALAIYDALKGGKQCSGGGKS